MLVQHTTCFHKFHK